MKFYLKLKSNFAFVLRGIQTTFRCILLIIVLFSLVSYQVVFAQPNDQKPAQVHSIFFTPNSVSLSALKEFILAEQNVNYLTASLYFDVDKFSLPVTVELDVKDKAKAQIETELNEKIIQSLTFTSQGLKQIKPIVQPKFDRADALSIYNNSSSNSSKVPLTEEELQFFENSGVLPPPRLGSEREKQELSNLTPEIRSSLANFDKSQRGRWTNAWPDEREAVLTQDEKNQRDQMVRTMNLQNEVATWVQANPNQAEQIKNIDLDKITAGTITYFTSVKTNSAYNLNPKKFKLNSDIDPNYQITLQIGYRYAIPNSSLCTKKNCIKDNLELVSTNNLDNSPLQMIQPRVELSIFQQYDYLVYGLALVSFVLLVGFYLTQYTFKK
jgi:hypothetical protein